MIDAVVGGILIGIAASLMLFGIGRIAGNSGILGGLFTFRKDKAGWRACYVIGLFLGGVLYQASGIKALDIHITDSVIKLILAGFLVGFGTLTGGGCTSGHGVCGMARLSKRSITATLVFMASAMLTVWVMKVL